MGRTRRQFVASVVLFLASALPAPILAGQCEVETALRAWEFHPDHVRLVDAFRLQCGGVAPHHLRMGGPMLYDFKDLESVAASSNAKVASLYVAEEEWRHTFFVRASPSLDVLEVDAGGVAEVTVEYRFSRASYLHTMTPIRPGVPVHFGASTPSAPGPHAYVLAFPTSADLVDVPHAQPTEVVTTDDWVSLAYVLPAKAVVAAHARFVLHDDAPARPAEQYLRLMHELRERYPVPPPVSSEPPAVAQAARKLASLRPPVPLGVQSPDLRVAVDDDPSRRVDQGLPERLTRVWLPRYVVGRPALIGSRVACSMAEQLVTFEADTGMPGPGLTFDEFLSTGPVVDGDQVLVGTASYRVYALDRESLDFRWAFTADGAITGAPVASGGSVFVVSSDGRIYALDRENGRLRWWSDVNVRDVLGLPAPPAVDDGSVVAVASTAGDVTLFQAESGRSLWTSNVADVLLAAPVMVGGAVIAADTLGVVHGLDRESGEEAWRTDLGQFVSVDLVPLDDAVLVVTSEGLVARLDARSGAIEWILDLGGRVGSHGASVAGRDLVVVLGEGSGLAAVDVDTGSLRWVVGAGGKAPFSLPAARPGLAVFQAGRNVDVIGWVP